MHPEETFFMHNIVTECRIVENIVLHSKEWEDGKFMVLEMEPKAFCWTGQVPNGHLVAVQILWNWLVDLDLFLVGLHLFPNNHYHSLH